MSSCIVHSQKFTKSNSLCCQKRIHGFNFKAQVALAYHLSAIRVTRNVLILALALARSLFIFFLESAAAREEKFPAVLHTSKNAPYAFTNTGTFEPKAQHKINAMQIMNFELKGKINITFL